LIQANRDGREESDRASMTTVQAGAQHKPKGIHKAFVYDVYTYIRRGSRVHWMHSRRTPKWRQSGGSYPKVPQCHSATFVKRRFQGVFHRVCSRSSAWFHVDYTASRSPSTFVLPFFDSIINSVAIPETRPPSLIPLGLGSTSGNVSCLNHSANCTHHSTTSHPTSSAAMSADASSSKRPAPSVSGPSAKRPRPSASQDQIDESVDGDEHEEDMVLVSGDTDEAARAKVARKEARVSFALTHRRVLDLALTSTDDQESRVCPAITEPAQSPPRVA
jgi:hypothetical protein